jgi:hydroxyacylglutathione hydrolase
MGWRIDCVVVGPIRCNCYILSDTTSNKAYLIDPGAESRELMDYLERRNFELQAVLITHSHIDHIGGIEMLHAEYPVPIYYHGADKPLFDNITSQAQIFGILPPVLQARQPKTGSGTLQDNQIFPFEGGELKVIHTPGHTPGSVCFHATGLDEVVFTGDTLFCGSIGRTDLWGGSYEQIIQSIKERLLTLDDRVKVLPGHGDDTTIGTERRHNSFLLED